MSAVSPRPQILIIENETSLLISLMRHLTHAGCEVTAANNARDALQLVQRGEFHLILLGLKLPDSSGFELFERLKKGSSSPPILFIAHDHDDENWQRGLELGAADFIEGPFQGTALVRRILSHLHANPERRASYG